MNGLADLVKGGASLSLEMPSWRLDKSVRNVTAVAPAVFGVLNEIKSYFLEQ